MWIIQICLFWYRWTVAWISFGGRLSATTSCCWDNSGKDIASVMTILFGLIKVIKWALGIRKLIVLERSIIPRHAMTLVMNLSLLNIIYIIFIVCYNIVYHLVMGTALANVHDHDFPLFFLVRCFSTSGPCSDYVSHHRYSVLGNVLCSVNIYFGDI